MTIYSCESFTSSFSVNDTSLNQLLLPSFLLCFQLAFRCKEELSLLSLSCMYVSISMVS